MVLLFLRYNLQYRDIFIDCCCVFWLWKMEALCGLGGDDGRRGGKNPFLKWTKYGPEHVLVSQCCYVQMCFIVYVMVFQ